jgi:phospholipid/cholesterol/gamma-HCH transport system permease protein
MACMKRLLYLADLAEFSNQQILLGLAAVVYVLGVALGLYLADTTPGKFDVRYGLVKSASFGAAVALIGCRAGLSTSGGAQGVGRGATRAVVISAVMILVLDAFWAMVWLTNRTIK